MSRNVAMMETKILTGAVTGRWLHMRTVCLRCLSSFWIIRQPDFVNKTILYIFAGFTKGAPSNWLL